MRPYLVFLACVVLASSPIWPLITLWVLLGGVWP